MSLYSQLTQLQDEEDKKKRELQPSQVAAGEQKKKSIFQELTEPVKKEVVQPKKKTFLEKAKQTVTDFGKEAVSGFKVGIPQAVSSLKRSGGELLNLLAKTQEQPGIYLEPKASREARAETISKEAQKLKEAAYADFKKSNLLNAELPIVEDRKSVV